MYPEDLIAPMRAELTNAGFEEFRDAEDMKAAIHGEGTTLVVINSVCGCAAGSCRPGVRMALSSPGAKPTRAVTAFAGNDKSSVDMARGLMLPFPPSSPSIALFKDGELVHMIERHHIEGRSAQALATNLTAAFEEFCS
jgi:putative YphP/YqiW family bacilliredoxin